MKTQLGDSEVYRPPFSEMAQTRGSRVLVCRGSGGKAWHAASWEKRRAEIGPWSQWTFVLDGELVKRTWSYVRLCGAGRRYPAQEAKYGSITCKRCMKALFKKRKAET